MFFLPASEPNPRAIPTTLLEDFKKAEQFYDQAIHARSRIFRAWRMPRLASTASTNLSLLRTRSTVWKIKSAGPKPELGVAFAAKSGRGASGSGSM